MIDLTLNHKDDKGEFIGPYRVGDKVQSNRFLGAIGTVTHCAGWKKFASCYCYWITCDNGAFFHLPETDIEPLEQHEEN